MEMTLRSILIVIGVLIVAAIVYDGWRRMQHTAKTRSQRKSRTAAPAVDYDDPLFIDDEDTSPRIEPVLDDSATLHSPASKGSVVDAYADDAYPKKETTRHEAPHSKVAIEKKGGDPKLRETLVVFHVLAKDNTHFDGPNVLQALLSMGLKHGEMSIFHRHEQPNGQGEVEFSVASMAEPGIFDLDTMGSFVTPGLSLFLKIPGPVNPLHTMDAMLEAADKLATRLGGDVVDQDFAPLTAEGIEALRAGVAEVCRHNQATYQQWHG